ncbi:MAG: helix-turn-helix domain-containing protein [Candidatus Dojkabacteria bacterium]|nr:MAG: helix-turn-helix domain-containing protein [Candidatus Dojkabacteria bacterium]
MTRSTAQRYANIFQSLTEAESLVMLDYLRQKGGEVTLKELADEANTSESRARGLLEELEQVYLVNENRENGETTYYYESTTVADRLRYILDRME